MKAATLPSTPSGIFYLEFFKPHAYVIVSLFIIII